MNTLFGSSGGCQSSDELTARMADAVKEAYKSSTSIVPALQGIIGCSQTGQRLIGYSSDEGVRLFFFGILADRASVEGLDEACIDPNEIALHFLGRYKSQGESFLDDIAGDYVVALTDDQDETVLLACGPSALRAIYYSIEGGALIFATQLCLFKTLCDGDVKLDREHEDFLLIYGFSPQGRTLLSSVSAIQPGKKLVWRKGKVSHSDISFQPVSCGFDICSSDADCYAALYDVFMATLRRQAAGYDRVEVLLGGFDSALVAAGLNRIGKKVGTWSFGYSQSEFNQPHVEEVSNSVGGEHHWIPMDEQVIRNGLERFGLDFNAPTNWPNYVIQTAALCERIAQEGRDICFSGDGCDTVFLGYPGTWRRTRVLAAMPRIPKSLQRFLIWALARPALDRFFGHPWRVMLNILRSSTWPSSVRTFLSFRIFDESSIAGLKGNAHQVPPGYCFEMAKTISQPYQELPVMRLGYAGKSMVSPNRSKMTTGSAKSGLAIMSPYLDPIFKSFAEKLPVELSRPDDATGELRISGKKALSEMAKKYDLLPGVVVDQPKIAAVDAPVDHWYANSLRECMLQLFEYLPFDADRKHLEALLEPHAAEKYFMQYLLTDRVIKHGPSLLATYASVCKEVAGVRKVSRF